MNNIFLIGYMGTGKSTVARYFSQNYGMNLLEMDEMIVEREGMCISDIFSKKGEEYFRNLETDLLIEIRLQKNQIVSCGGGVVLRSQNVDEMKKSGSIVLLTASPETILTRVQDDESRPLLKGNKNVEFIRDMMERRREKYEDAADVVVHTDEKSIAAICEEILKETGRMDNKDV